MGTDEEGRQGSPGSHLFRFDSALVLDLVVLTVASAETLKMVNVKNGIKLSEGTKARGDSTSKKRPRGEDKELTLSKNIIQDSDEELAPLDN